MKKSVVINLTPYKEIRGGELSIYDFVKEGYTVPQKPIFMIFSRQCGGLPRNFLMVRTALKLHFLERHRIFLRLGRSHLRLPSSIMILQRL